MRILKRNQLIILVVSLMLITAGYLNFTANQENTAQTSITANRDNSTIGDAQLVSTIPKENEEKTVENLVTGNNEEEVKNEQSKEEQQSDVIDTSNDKEDYFFTSSKLERNTMYSELLESYQDIYNDVNASGESKSVALKNISKINSTKNAIMIAENLIIAKGFEDVVIFVNDNSVSVIIKTDDLKTEHVAQIQNIVSRELNVNTETIHISAK